MNYICIGWYWVDPNLGVPNDAIQVWCNITSGGKTCVYPNYKTRMVRIIIICHVTGYHLMSPLARKSSFN